MIERYLMQNTLFFVNEFERVNSIDKVLSTNSCVIVNDDEGNYRGLLSAIDLIKKPHFIVTDCISNRPIINVENSIEEGLEIIRNSNFNEYPVVLTPIKQECSFKFR